MVRRKLISLLLALSLVLAAISSLVQPVAVANTHTGISIEALVEIADHGHSHTSDHDSSDHMHDVVVLTAVVEAPPDFWPRAWTSPSDIEFASADLRDNERPPRTTVTL